MLEAGVLGSFIAALAVCIFTGKSILYALLAGYLIFSCYALKKGNRPAEVFRMSLSGIRTVKNILMIFGLIGLITALWRASGTIPVIVCYASRLIVPSAFVMLTFLFNVLLSVLTGTSFGTAATMGVICMSMGKALQINPLYIGGAVLGGAFWGDRCSPVSSSANLVCTLTKTDLFENIHRMLKTALVPTLLTCVIYYVLGCSSVGDRTLFNVEELFADSFCLHWSAVLPAAAILFLAAFRVPVKRTLGVSAVLACIFCITLQNMKMSELLPMLLFGYQTKNPELASMLNGGGLVSMLRAACIVMLSSSYAGIFEKTGLLQSLQTQIDKLSGKLTSFGGTLVVSVFTSMISCNQTLAIMLTNQLCSGTESDPKRFALTLEDTVVLLAPLIPWSIAGTVPLHAVDAPMRSIWFACYLYLQPLWSYLLVVKHSDR